MPGLHHPAVACAFSVVNRQIPHCAASRDRYEAASGAAADVPARNDVPDSVNKTLAEEKQAILAWQCNLDRGDWPTVVLWDCTQAAQCTTLICMCLRRGMVHIPNLSRPKTIPAFAKGRLPGNINSELFAGKGCGWSLRFRRKPHATA